jgi:RNA-directed DNA polymerase
MSKDERGRNSSLSEKPVRSRPRRLADWINLTGAKKVHSLIDKVYKRKNLEMAWEKVRRTGAVEALMGRLWRPSKCNWNSSWIGCSES